MHRAFIALKKNRKIIYLFSFFLITLLVGWFFIRDNYLYLDEHPHFATIHDIATFNIHKDSFFGRHSALPGYHFTMAILVWLVQFQSFAGYRLLQVVLSLCLTLVFYLLVKLVDPKNAFIKSLQFFFLPVMFIFYFLIFIIHFRIQHNPTPRLCISTFPIYK